MKKLLLKIKEFRKNEEGSALLATLPFMIILFVTFLALVFNVAVLTYKRQQLQIIADSASRAGTLAIREEYAVKESNGKYHVYIELDEDKADANATRVIEESKRYLKGAQINSYAFNPEGSNFVYPEWSSKAHKYNEKPLSTHKQYFNGNFSVLMDSDAHGVWEDLLGLGHKFDITTYSSSAARGSAAKK